MSPYTYFVYNKKIELNSYESAYDILDKIEKEYKDKLFISGFNAYDGEECVIYLIDNNKKTQPCYSSSRRVKYQQFKDKKRNLSS
jgi:hypothetical protein